MKENRARIVDAINQYESTCSYHVRSREEYLAAKQARLSAAIDLLKASANRSDWNALVDCLPSKLAIQLANHVCR
jgi:hypothetical protein